jgi:hypothetical protein
MINLGLGKSEQELGLRAKHVGAAEIFRIMNSEEESNKTLDQLRALPDSILDMMGKMLKVPENQIPIYKSLMRGEDNIFINRLSEFDGKLQSGDVILMTGNHQSSKLLVVAQQSFYSKARSSHVAIILSDMVCVDAIPSIGVSHRLISEVLAETENDWRVIRFKGINNDDNDRIQQQCAYYLSQPYKIFPSSKSIKKYTYCSELARKIFTDCRIKNTGIPNTKIIKPCDFDRIADSNPDWIDITDEVKEYINFCSEYEVLCGLVAKLLVDGLKLNYHRFEQRQAEIHKINIMMRQRKISKEEGDSLKKEIYKINEKMHFKFWNF